MRVSVNRFKALGASSALLACVVAAASASAAVSVNPVFRSNMVL